MAIKLELFGENPEAFKRELDSLADLIRPVVQASAAPVTVTLAGAVDGASFQELHDLVVARFDREGYEVAITARETKPMTAVEAEAVIQRAGQGERPPAALASIETAAGAEAVVREPARTKGRPRLATVETAVRKLKGNGGEEPEAVFESGEDAELIGIRDRQFVLDTLGKLVKDPAHKAKVLAFAARAAGEYGVAKLVEVSPRPFLKIRRLMEEAFPGV